MDTTEIGIDIVKSNIISDKCDSDTGEYEWCKLCVAKHITTSCGYISLNRNGYEESPNIDFCDPWDDSEVELVDNKRRWTCSIKDSFGKTTNKTCTAIKREKGVRPVLTITKGK